jgi:hypothetical protein
MKICLAFKALLTTSLLAFALTTNLNAFPTLTWVSGVGDDGNPCSHTAPCLTFAGALGQTNPSGQISALDPGNFASATITQAVTIDGNSIPTEIVASVAGTSLTISAGATDVVILRHLTLNGAGVGTTGIQFNSGQQLIIQDCSIVDFTDTGISINSTNAGNVVIINTTISNGTTGISVNGTTSPLNVSLLNVSIKETTTAGVDALFGNVDIANSFITQNSGVGVKAEGTSVVSCSNNVFTSNGTALQSVTGATIRISNNDFYDNGTTIGNSGGVVATANNNREAGSGTPGTPTTSIIFQ